MTRRDRVAVRSGILLCLAFAPAAGIAQLPVSGTAAVSLVEHQVDIGYGVEESRGLLFGAEGAVTLASRLELTLRAAGGSLSTDATGAENRDVGEVGLQASVAAARWLALRGALTSRTYTTAIARQRWTTVELGAEARLDFATTPLRGVLRGGLLPVVKVRGLPGPDVALTAREVDIRKAGGSVGFYLSSARPPVDDYFPTEVGSVALNADVGHGGLTPGCQREAAPIRKRDQRNGLGCHHLSTGRRIELRHLERAGESIARLQDNHPAVPDSYRSCRALRAPLHRPVGEGQRHGGAAIGLDVGDVGIGIGHPSGKWDKSRGGRGSARRPVLRRTPARHDPASPRQLRRARESVRGHTVEIRDHQIAVDKPSDGPVPLDRKVAQRTELAVGGDPSNPLVVNEQHRPVTQEQYLHQDAPRRRCEAPALLARGEPGDREHERWRVARRGVGGAVQGHGGNNCGDHTPVVKHDLPASDGHRVTERDSGLADLFAVAVHGDDRGRAAAPRAGKQVETISVRGHPRHRSADVRLPQPSAVRGGRRQPRIRGARGDRRHQGPTHPRYQTGLQVGALRQPRSSQLEREIGSEIAGPDDPAVRGPATLDHRSEYHDQQVVAHQRLAQEPRPPSLAERPAPAGLSVAHRDQLGSARLLPPVEITRRIAHKQRNDNGARRRGVVDPALRTGPDPLR